jgi:hypothetical protein
MHSFFVARWQNTVSNIANCRRYCHCMIRRTCTCSTTFVYKMAGTHCTSGKGSVKMKCSVVCVISSFSFLLTDCKSRFWCLMVFFRYYRLQKSMVMWAVTRTLKEINLEKRKKSVQCYLFIHSAIFVLSMLSVLKWVMNKYSKIPVLLK